MLSSLKEEEKVLMFFARQLLLFLTSITLVIFFTSDFSGSKHVSSDEYQCFIRTTIGDVEKALSVYQKVNTEDLITRYATNFSNLAGV